MPELRLLDLDTWCSIGALPHLLSGYLRQWLAVHFSDSVLIEFPQLRSLIWQEAAPTGILVEVIERWKPSQTETRPAFLVKRNDYQGVVRGLNSEMQGHIARDGAQHFGEFLAGSHTIFALSTLPQQAEIMGAELYRELAQFAPQVRKELNLVRFRFGSWSGLFKVKEAQENWATALTVAFEIEQTWLIREQTPFLKKLVIQDFV